FLEPYGLLLALLGLIYLAAFVIGRGTNDDLAYRIGMGLGLAGLLVFLVALGRSVIPPLLYSWKWTDTPPAMHAMPAGVPLTLRGLVSAGTAWLLCSEPPLVVIPRRGLASCFSSPIPHIMLLAFPVSTWGSFVLFLGPLLGKNAEVSEPVVSRFVWSL